jgi:diguanylate cyclase
MQAILNVVDSTAFMAGLALFYGTLRRQRGSRSFQDALLGVSFGLGAILSMLQPVLTFGNVIIDARILFTGFAGAFLGVEGAVAALAVAALGRLSINVSPAAFVGIFGMSISTVAGFTWQRIKPFGGMSWKCLAGLGVMISLSYSALWLVPELKGSVPIGSVAMLTVYNVLGSVALGTFLYREQDLQSREASALEAAATDPLTGLLNRRGFSARFVEAEADRQAQGSALLFIDIDHFKSINDAFGHSGGDEILRATAKRIRTAVRPEDIVLRVGGEEFGVLLKDVDEARAWTSAERIRTSVSEDYQLRDGRTVSITASVGGFCWETGSVPEEIAANSADLALYAAKAGGRDRSVFEERRRV